MDAARPEPPPFRRASGPVLPLSDLVPPLVLLLLLTLGLMPLLEQRTWWPDDPGRDETVRRIGTTLVWAASLWLLARGADVLLWERLLPRRTGVRIPRLLRQVAAVVLWIIGAALVVSQVWQVSVGPVLATTGALGIVAGLALRNVLADFFSGIALNMEHPFRLDDFVLFHIRGKRDPVAGFVREINWRSTTVLTPEDNLISVPNSLVAASTVENLSFPSPVYELELEIQLDWRLDTALVDRVLGAAMVDAWVSGATSGDKPPKFRICRLDGAGVAYKIVYLIDPRKKPKGPARHTLLSCLHTHLRFAGLRPVMAGVPGLQAAPAAGANEEPGPQRARLHEDAADRLLALEQVPLLAVLTPAERASLAAGAQVCRVEAGTAVVRAGEAGSSMFIVAAGVLEVLLPPRAAGEADAAAAPAAGAGAGAVAAAQARVATLSPGAFFGEMSLLTGEARTATVSALCTSVLYEVSQAQMSTLLAERPGLAEALSAVMSDHLRRDSAAARRLVPGGAPARPQGLAEALAQRMRRYLAPRA